MYADLNQKKCAKCSKVKNLSEFGTNRSRKDGLFPWCKVCKSESDRLQYQKNSDRIKAATRQWKAKNPDRKRELNREYKKRNKDKVNLNTQNYKKRNVGITNANTAKRRAALLKRTPKWLTDFDLRYIKCFYEAAYIISKETGIHFEVDHIVPLQGADISGLHVPSNLQVIPASANQAKKNTYKV